MNANNKPYGLKEGFVNVTFDENHESLTLKLVLYMQSLALFKEDGEFLRSVLYEECEVSIENQVIYIKSYNINFKIITRVEEFVSWHNAFELLFDSRSILLNNHLGSNAEEIAVEIQELKLSNLLLTDPLSLDALYEYILDFLHKTSPIGSLVSVDDEFKLIIKILSDNKNLINEKIENISASENQEIKSNIASLKLSLSHTNQLIRSFALFYKKYIDYTKNQLVEESSIGTQQLTSTSNSELFANLQLDNLSNVFEYISEKECELLISNIHNLDEICHSVLYIAESDNTSDFERLCDLSKKTLFELIKSVHSILSSTKSSWICKNIVSVLKTFHQGWSSRLRVTEDSLNSASKPISTSESLEYLENSIKILEKNVVNVLRLKNEEGRLEYLLTSLKSLDLTSDVKSKLIMLVIKTVSITQDFFFAGKNDKLTVNNLLVVIEKVRSILNILVSGKYDNQDTTSSIKFCSTIKEQFDRIFDIFQNSSSEESQMEVLLLEFNNVVSLLYQILSTSLVDESEDELEEEYVSSREDIEPSVAPPIDATLKRRSSNVQRKSSSMLANAVSTENQDAPLLVNNEVPKQLTTNTIIIADEALEEESIELSPPKTSMSIIEDIYPTKPVLTEKIEMVQYTVAGTNLPPLTVPKTINIWDEPPTNVIYQDELENITPSELNTKFATSTSTYNKTTSLMNFSEERVLRLASINSLIIELTNYEKYNQEFSDVFLNTFNSFMSPEHLWIKLLERYNISPNVNPSRLDQIKNPLHLLVLNVIVKWLRTQPWTVKKHLISHMEYFADTSLLKDGFSQGRTKLKNLFLEVQKSEMESELPKSLLNFKKLDTGKKLNLLDDSYDLKKVAQQFMLLDWELFLQIKPMDLIDSTQKVKPQSIQKCTNRFNQVSSWVAYSILQEKNLPQRAKLYSKLINFAKILYNFKNFNSCMAIISGFNNSAVHRLYQTQVLLSKKDLSTREYLNRELSSDNSYKRYRQLITQTIPPLVPFLGVFLSDLLFIEEGNKDTVHGLINFHKRRMQYKVVSTLQSISQMPLDIPTDSELLPVIQNLDYIDSERELYKLSLSIEPRLNSKV